MELLHRLAIAAFSGKFVQQNAREESVSCRISQDGDEVELQSEVLKDVEQVSACGRTLTKRAA